ncbi:gamma-glutamyltranspeptidase [Mariprofundus erugo]|uniref:gamma-glutamyltransferase family protein n=1 Tax=Mariprofundus erugo TaxID=2528639 RepID=UPI0010FEF891|nr:gamma-glutamyltransferase [Mariprofundus erugo]TLS74007.1 gamma-glutamyltranspeptidase [Mariprofundus erugo]
MQQRHGTLNRGTVAAGHPATADAGAAVLRMGGNAVDAAIAAVTTAFIAEPALTSAGGGGFLLLCDRHGKSVLYDGFARMPSGRMPDGCKALLKPVAIDFGDTVQTFHIGQGSVATPALPALLFHAHRQHGRLPLAEAMAPGIDAARNGIRLNHLQASLLKMLQPIVTDTAEASALHAPHGELIGAGDLFCNRALANTLELLLIEGIDEMYHGDLARAIVRACVPYGLLGMEDMRAPQVATRTPLATPLFGGTLLTNPPPSSGGLLLTCAALLFDQLKGKAEAPVLLAECLRAASMLRNHGITGESFDARIYQQDIALQTLDKQAIQRAADAICDRLRHAADTGKIDPEADNRHGSTTHISIIDKDGMAVSLTSSNGEGSGIVVPDSGIHLNNMLGEEDINPLGFHALPAGTPLSSMMAPSIFLRHGQPAMVIGSGGSNRLRGAILQVLLRHQLLQQDLETAVYAPRLHNEAMRLECEPEYMNDQLRESLQALGWNIREWQQQSVYFGGVHAIALDERNRIQASGDPRRGGAVAFA